MPPRTALTIEQLGRDDPRLVQPASTRRPRAARAPIQPVWTSPGMARTAKTTRNAVTISATATTWSTCGTTTSRVRLLRCSHDSRRQPASAGLATATSGATGVPRRSPGSPSRSSSRSSRSNSRRNAVTHEQRRHEQQERQHERELAGVHGVGDLPDLGAEQQEHDQDHEHGQRSRNELDEMGELEPQALERPHPDLDEAEADDDVDRPDAGQRTERRRDEFAGVLIDRAPPAGPAGARSSRYRACRTSMAAARPVDVAGG